MDEPRESPSSLIGVLAAVLLAIIIIVALVWIPEWPRADARPSRRATSPAITAVVVTAGALNLGKANGGTREVLTVRTEDGRVLTALTLYGGPMKPGQKVELSESLRAISSPALPSYDATPAK